MGTSFQLPVIQSGPPADGDSAIDPVCGMTVAKAGAKHKHSHAGTEYYFCCQSCANKFAANPRQYLHADGSAAGGHAHHGAAKPGRPDAIYVCPMHPEVREVGPGTSADIVESAIFERQQPGLRHAAVRSPNPDTSLQRRRAAAARD